MKRIALYFFMLLISVQATAAQTTFHGDTAHTGVYGSAGPKQLNAVKWAFKTGGPIISSPAISDGVVFFGSADNCIYAVDQNTGKEKWKQTTEGPVVSSPAVANGLVYISSYDGGFYALAADTGKLKWQFQMEYEKRFEAKGLHGHKPKTQVIPDTWDFFMSSPVVSNGRVYFGSGDGNVYALDALTGVLQWKFATKDTVHASPAIANNTVYIGSFDSNLYALDADTGAEKWRFKAGEDPVDHNQVGFQSSPTVIDGTVYVGCRDAHVYAIDAKTGIKKWDYYTNKFWVSNTPAVRDGIVYVGTNDLYALDAKTGQLRFSFGLKTGLFSSPVLAGDLVYIGAFNGKLYAADAKSGKPSWEFQTENSKKDPMKVMKPDWTWNPEAFTPVFNDFQDMYITMARRFSVGSILSTPVVDHGGLYFGSTDGFLYALQ
jgi:outer membrane protein assembly factor BamB